MRLQGLRNSSAFASQAMAGLTGAAFRLVDVGYTGGLGAGWRSLGEALTVLAIVDPQSAQTPEQAVKVAPYHGLAPRQPAYRSSPLGRLSVTRAREVRAAAAAGIVPEPLGTWVRNHAGSATPGKPADLDYLAAFACGASDLAKLIEAEGFAEADFLRVDCGDGDYERLRELAPLLQRPSLLGVGVRVRFFGTEDANDNTFHNVDRLMRRMGFDLFRIEPVFYSAAALSWPFMAKHPDNTAGGRPIYGQAIYLRDLAQAPSSISKGLADADLLKSAALMALFNLPDYAAEILTVFEGRLAKSLDLDRALDLLAVQVQEDNGSALDYRDYVKSMEAEDFRLFDFSQRHFEWLMGLQQTARQAPARIAELEDLVRDLSLQLYQDRTASRPSPAFDPQAAQAEAVRRSRLHPEHHWIFDHFKPYRGLSATDGLLDFIGTKIGTEFGDVEGSMAVEMFTAANPPIGEEYFEWIDVLQSVLEAGDTFTMLELGAGYGRWSARAALAARQLGKSLRLGLAEAEPKHQVRLRAHLQANGVSPSEYRVFGSAVGGSVGEVAFTVEAPPHEEPGSWFGQFILTAELGGSEPVGEYYGSPVYEHQGWKLILVPQIPLSQVLKDYDFIDLADFDLQAAERQAIPEAIEMLTQKVRRMHIGTHGHDIEAELRDLLPRHGWVCLRDYSLHATHVTPFGPAQFVDGVQSWINPALI